MSGQRWRVAALVCAVAGLVLAVPAATASEAAGVRIEGRKFTPERVTVAAGGSITWTNASSEDHNVRGGPFASPTLKPGNTYSFTFTRTGTVDYTCDFHPNMKGTIKVH